MELSQPLLGQTPTSGCSKATLAGGLVCLLLGFGAFWSRSLASNFDLALEGEGCAVGSKTNAMCIPSAPFLYLSFHGGRGKGRIRNVCRYTRDGCSLGHVLLPSDAYRPYGIRGLMVHGDRLIIAESYKRDSKIVEYSGCIPSKNNSREYVRMLIEGGVENPGLIHPYGMAKGSGDDYLYVSAQDTRAVLRYKKDNGEIGPLSLWVQNKLMKDENIVMMSSPSEKEFRNFVELSSSRKSLLADTKLKFVFPGTFVAFNNSELRGITFDRSGRLYVAAKQKGVLIFDELGQQIGRLDTDPRFQPISVFYCYTRNSIWVGLLKAHKLVEFDAGTLTIIQELTDPNLRHPAGMTTFGNSLFVLSQRSRKLLEFDMESGKFVRIILSGMLDDPERVTISPC